jgi:hypothetical protein
MIDVALSLLALMAGGLVLELFRSAWSVPDNDKRSGLGSAVPEPLEEYAAGNPS